MAGPVQTRVLIISDTHGLQLKKVPQVKDVDVVIHCGDLTEHSLLSEFQEAISLLQNLEAPLKLVIPGNHDFSLDEEVFAKKKAEFQRTANDPVTAVSDLESAYGADGAAKSLWNEASADSKGEIHLLDEGQYSFQLRNGARLKMYASPYTPSTEGWGFQSDSFHEFSIGDDVDIAITHGPPKGVLDRPKKSAGIGCPVLFRAIAKAKPRVHCFGHVHNGWGATLQAWRSPMRDNPSHLNSFDRDSSAVITNLQKLQGYQSESPEDVQMRQEKLARYEQQGYCDLHHSENEVVSFEAGKTLFVNAAMKGDGGLDQLPWIIDMDLTSS